MKLIDADAVINAIIELRKEVIKCKSYDEYDRAFFQGENDGLIEAENIVKHSLTIEPERKKGEWIETSDGTMCGNCHKFPYDDGEYHIANWYSDFCPNCGADMRGENE